ncbi:hypothetical protein Tco_1435425 [Tanacetum coccineum]
MLTCRRTIQVRSYHQNFREAGMSKDRSGSKSKDSKSSSSKDTKSQPKSSGKSAQAKEPVFEAADAEMP